MVKSSEKVIEKILLPSFPEVIDYKVEKGEVYLGNGGDNQYYNLLLTISDEISPLREQKLYEDTYMLFDMLGPKQEKLRVIIINN